MAVSLQYPTSSMLRLPASDQIPVESQQHKLEEHHLWHCSDGDDNFFSGGLRDKTLLSLFPLVPGVHKKDTHT